jgi:Cu/Ag efflux pump CusA
MRRIPKKEVSLHEDLKNSATFKQEDLISSKIGQYWANLISRMEFVSSVSYIYIYFYRTHAGSSLLLAFTMPLATSVTVHVIAQKITDTPHVKPQSTKRFEVGRLYILKINVNS